MNISNINDYIIKNSAGEILRFYLDTNSRIKYDLYDNNSKLNDQYLFSDDTVSAFSLDIDSRDRIHLIYINSDGNVYYNLYSNKKWAKKNLTKFDIRSNSYSGLVIRINKENINILYSFSNLINPKVWTIQHLLGTKGNWEKVNVISFTSGKSVPTFSFDFDKFDNMHLIYTSIIENMGRIYYTFYNSSAKKWNQVPKLLSEHQNNCSSPYILIDKIDNIHTLWVANKNNCFEIKYKHLPQLGSSKNTWKEETLPITNNEPTCPIIYEDKDILKIFTASRNKIFSLFSNDYGFSWNLVQTLTIPVDVKIQNANYLTNFPGEINSQKTSQVFFNINDKIILLKQELMDYIYKYSSIDVDNNEGISSEVDDLINTTERFDDKNHVPFNKEENLEQLKKYFNDLFDANLVLDSLSNISNNIKNIEDVNKSFAVQFNHIDNTLLAFKESIDINNQNLIEVQKIIEVLNNRTLRRGFWSRFFKRN